MTDLLDEARDVLRQHGEDLGRQALRELAMLEPADVIRFIQLVRRQRDRKIGLRVDAAKDAIEDALEARIRRDQGEGHE